MQFHGFDVYRTYLAMKQHFTKPSFDFFQYDGRVNVKESTYQQRNDFYFFETLARKLTALEVKEYLLASFVLAPNPAKVWIGDIKRTGKDKWASWQRTNQALKYNVEQDLNYIVKYTQDTETTFNDLFRCDDGGHPPLLRLHLRGLVKLETLMILDMVLGFMLVWDRKLDDPIWNPLSLKIKKYKPFVSIPVKEYRQLMKEKFS